MQIQFEITYLEFKEFNEQIVYSTVNTIRTKILYTVFIFLLTLLISLSFLTIRSSLLLSILMGLLMYTYGTKKILKFRNFLSVNQTERFFPRTYTFKFDDEYFVYKSNTSPKTEYEIPWFRVNSIKEHDKFYLLGIKKIGKMFIVKKTQVQQDNITNNMFQKRFNKILSENNLL